MDELKAVNFQKIKNINNISSLHLSGDYLFETNFFPNQFVKCEIYEDKIVITPALEEDSHLFFVNQ